MRRSTVLLFALAMIGIATSPAAAADRAAGADYAPALSNPQSLIPNPSALSPAPTPYSLLSTAQPNEAPESILRWLLRALGPEFAVIFLFLTINLVALMVMNVLAVSRENVVPPALLGGLDARLREKQYPQACELLHGDTSLLGRVLGAGVAKLPEGCDAAVAAMQEFGSGQAMKMRQRLGYVSLIAKIAPLVGILGTVDGMMTAFGALAQKGAAPMSGELAAGVWTALVASMVGFWITIFAQVFFHIARDRLERLLAEAGTVGEELLRRFAAARTGS